MQPQRSPVDIDRSPQVRLEEVLEHLSDYAIFMVHADRRVATWNAGAERIFGYSANEIVGQPVDVLFTPQDRARGVPRHEAESAAREGCAKDDRWHLRKDGSRFFGRGVLTASRNSAGDLRGFVKILRDSTERREAAHALAERERLLRQRV